MNQLFGIGAVLSAHRWLLEDNQIREGLRSGDVLYEKTWIQKLGEVLASLF